MPKPPSWAGGLRVQASSQARTHPGNDSSLGLLGMAERVPLLGRKPDARAHARRPVRAVTHLAGGGIMSAPVLVVIADDQELVRSGPEIGSAGRSADMAGLAADGRAAVDVVRRTWDHRHTRPDRRRGSPPGIWS